MYRHTERCFSLPFRVYGTALRTKNERFRSAKSIINLMDPKLVIFWATFFSLHFRDNLKPEMGPHFRPITAIETGVWIWVSTHRGRQQAMRYAENSSSPKTASICQASLKTCAVCCALLPTPAHLRHHHEPLGRGCYDCVDYESSCDVAQPQFLPRRGRGGQSPSGR